MSTARTYKTKYIAKSALVYSVVSLCLILTAKMLFAQQQSARSVTIVPPLVDSKLNPGDKREGTLKIVNNSSTELTFNASVKDFVVDDTLGTPTILPDGTLSNKYSAASWIAVTPDTFTLAPGKTQILNYYIQIPGDARPGGHYAAIVYAPKELLGVSGTGAGVEAHLGTLFYASVNGNIIENASVKEFKPDRTFQEYGPVGLTSLIVNYSDTHIRPQGTIVVKNLLGQVVYSQPIEGHNIFPEAVREFKNTVGRKLMFGRYTAELRATYGQNNNLTLFAITDFIVFPWKVVAIVVLILITAALLFIFLKRKKKNGTAGSQTNPQTPTSQPLS